MTEIKESLRIIALEATNVKRIKAVQIRPDGSVVEISGKNGQGKSSVLDALWWALVETKHIQDVPVRKGADRAVIKLDLGKLKITRTIRAPKEEGGEFTTTLKVENEEGFAAKAPQTMLDALVGQLSFDPLEFTRLKPEAQFNACRSFVPGFDFEAHAQTRRALFDERTGVNRTAKELNAQAEGIEVDIAAAGLVKVDEGELVAKLNEAGKHNADVERRRANRERAEAEIADCNLRHDQLIAESEELLRQAKAKREHAELCKAQADETRRRLDAAGALPEPIDTAALTSQIETARESNARIARAEDAARRRAELIDRAGAAEAKSKNLTAEIEALDKAKADAIGAAKLPVEGLSFGDGAVLFNGLPFDQASGAEQLRVSCAVAAALNPRLRVLRCKDGALLDADSMKLLGEFAEANDFQIWIETVASGRDGAIVIEDGMVKAAADQAVTQ